MPQTIEGFETNSPEMKAFLQQYIIILRDKLLEFYNGTKTEDARRNYIPIQMMDNLNGDKTLEEIGNWATNNPVDLALYEIWKNGGGARGERNTTTDETDSYGNSWKNLCHASSLNGRIIEEYLIDIFTTERRDTDVLSGRYLDLISTLQENNPQFNKTNITLIDLELLGQAGKNTADYAGTINYIIEELVFNNETVPNSFKYWYDGTYQQSSRARPYGEGAGNRTTYDETRIPGYEDFNLTDDYLSTSQPVPPSEPQPVPLPDIINHFGEDVSGTNPEYDINNDGIINVEDILTELSEAP